MKTESYHARRGFLFLSKNVKMVTSHAEMHSQPIDPQLYNALWVGETSSRTLECTRMLGGMGGYIYLYMSTYTK